MTDLSALEDATPKEKYYSYMYFYIPTFLRNLIQQKIHVVSCVLMSRQQEASCETSHLSRGTLVVRRSPPPTRDRRAASLPLSGAVHVTVQY